MRRALNPQVVACAGAPRPARPRTTTKLTPSLPGARVNGPRSQLVVDRFHVPAHLDKLAAMARTGPPKQPLNSA
jgi:hypothetical protein